MLGEEFHALQQSDAVSPKFRVPTHSYVFKNFNEANKIESKDFVAVGSLATGGLSNAWGCGVARLSAGEFAEFPCSSSDFDEPYEIVAKRIGISGRNDDDMADYFGVDGWAQLPIQMDILHQHLYEKFTNRATKYPPQDFRLGRSRVAVLSAAHAGRLACDNSGNCLWGCQRGAMYSSKDELPLLRSYKNFHEHKGLIVDQLIKNGNMWTVAGLINSSKERRAITASRVVLAAGTLATTRIALQALKYEQSVRVLSCPTAAFLLWLPRFLGAARTPAFGLGQLSFSLGLKNDVTAFGSTFATTGIPISEFARHLPMQRRVSIDFLSAWLSSCLVGNVFLPGKFSSSTAQLRGDGVLSVQGGGEDEVNKLMPKISARLRQEYARLGAWMVPQSFTLGKRGSDIHYAGTLPMRKQPLVGETNEFGELQGLQGVYVVDGACLPVLSEKSHTLTVMANAVRIGQELVKELMREKTSRV